LIPFIDELWTNDEFAGKAAILLMDSCSIHARTGLFATVTEDNVKEITFPPHTTQMFHATDRVDTGDTAI
jgi:hypothetical protein